MESQITLPSWNYGYDKEEGVCYDFIALLNL